MEERLTATANSGIGSGNLYSAALQMCVVEEESESGVLWVLLLNEGYEYEHSTPIPLGRLYTKGTETKIPEEEEQEEEDTKGNHEWDVVVGATPNLQAISFSALSVLCCLNPEKESGNNYFTPCLCYQYGPSTFQNVQLSLEFWIAVDVALIYYRFTPQL